MSWIGRRRRGDENARGDGFGPVLVACVVFTKLIFTCCLSLTLLPGSATHDRILSCWHRESSHLCDVYWMLVGGDGVGVGGGAVVSLSSQSFSNLR